MVGTIAYMAPEQMQGAVSAAVDMYARGVVPYEPLTGQLPFDGDSFQVPTAKFDRAPLAPGALRPDVSLKLEELALDLLSVPPLKRPTAAQVLERLDAPSSLERRVAERSAQRFVGRHRELAELRQHFRSAERQRARLAVVEASGGAGKSALLTRFIHDLDRQVPVLRGRCHPFEHVRYNAFDEVFVQLKQRSEAQPSVAAQLAAFLHPFAHQDAQTQRAALFDNLLAALESLAEERTLVVALDDLQSPTSWRTIPSSRMLTSRASRSVVRSRLNLLAQVPREAPARSDPAITPTPAV